ncbi:MAG: MnhB domain-containing protein [Acidimicrobiia bacterium]
MINRSLVLDVLVDLVVRTALVFSLFLLFSGHNAPGGGFIAGLVAGISIVLRYIAGGHAGVRSVIGVRPEGLLGVGLSVAVLTGMLGWVWGEAFLESAKFEVELPVLGVVKATSALPFDIGVFLVVVGVALAMIAALGQEEEV